MLTRGALQQGRNFGITAGGGGGELVLPDQKSVSEVVPEQRTFDQSLSNHFSLLLFPTTITFQSETLKYFQNLPD